MLHAETADLISLSPAIEAEIVDVMNRPRFKKMLSDVRRVCILDILRGQAAWFDPTERVTDCRDQKDNKYLELALAAGADTIIMGASDLLVLHPWRGIRILGPTDYLTAVRAADIPPGTAIR